MLEAEVAAHPTLGTRKRGARLRTRQGPLPVDSVRKPVGLMVSASIESLLLVFEATREVNAPPKRFRQGRKRYRHSGTSQSQRLPAEVLIRFRCNVSALPAPTIGLTSRSIMSGCPGTLNRRLVTSDAFGLELH